MLSYSRIKDIIAFAPLVQSSFTKGIIQLHNLTSNDMIALSIPESLEDAPNYSTYRYTTHDKQGQEAEDEPNETIAEDQYQNDNEMTENVTKPTPDTNKGDPKKFISAAAVTDMAFDNTSTYLAALTDASLLFLFNIITGELVAYKPVPRRPTCVIFSPDNRFIIFGDRLGDVYAVNIADFLSSTSTNHHFLFSVGCVITSLSINTIYGKQYIVCGDQEQKIRVSCFPDIFDIQSMCMGQLSIISSANLINLKDSKAIIFASSTNPPINTYENDQEIVIPSSITPNRCLISTWEPLTGSKLYCNKPIDFKTSILCADDQGDAQITYPFVCLLHSTNDIALLAPFTLSCGRIANSTAYVQTSTFTGASFQSLIPVQISTGEQLSILFENVAILEDRKIVYVIAVKDNSLCGILEDNSLVILHYKVALDTKIVTIQAKTILSTNLPQIIDKPYPSFMIDIHARLIEAFYKHEFFFQANTERKKLKEAKKQRKTNN